MNAAEIKARMLASFTKYPTYRLMEIQDVLDAYAEVCSKILAEQKPVATRENVGNFLLALGWEGQPDDQEVDDVIAAIHHFVPQRMNVPSERVIFDAYMADECSQGLNDRASLGLAFARLARAMMLELQNPAVAPARTDIPDYDTIYQRFAKIRAENRGFWDDHKAARIVHAMMLKLAPREKMQIEGMGQDAIHAKLQVAAGYNAISQNALVGIVKEVLRLANTPAEPKPDPDAEAKRLAWVSYTTLHSNPAKALYKTADEYWKRHVEVEKDCWRAVAAARREG